jgi:hypothetical protein
MEFVFLEKYVRMILQPIFEKISDRLNFLFPPNSFVYINLSPDSNGRLSSGMRFALCEQLEQHGMSLAFPPDLDNDTLDLSQTDEDYWTYHFPGLKSLHRRKQGILVGELLRGVNLQLAGHLMLRKLNIEADQQHYLLYFGYDGTWCCAHREFQSEKAMCGLMLQIAQSGIPSSPELNYNASIDREQSFKTTPDISNNRQNWLRNLYDSVVGSPDFREPGVDYDKQALLEDEDVLRTLQAIQRTETEKGFYKVVRALLQEVYHHPQASRELVPVLGQIMLEAERRPFRLEINGFRNSIDFEEIDTFVQLRPLDFSLYRLFYNHPNGFKLSDRPQYLDEMRNIYRGVTGIEDEDRINSILEPMFILSKDNSSMNQSISRIKARFRSRMDVSLIQPYIISGERNRPYRIAALTA